MGEVSKEAKQLLTAILSTPGNGEEFNASAEAVIQFALDMAARPYKEQLAEALKWKDEDPRMLREQIRVADVAYNGLLERFKALEVERDATTLAERNRCANIVKENIRWSPRGDKREIIIQIENPEASNG